MKWNLRGLIIPGDDFIVSYSDQNTFRIYLNSILEKLVWVQFKVSALPR